MARPKLPSATPRHDGPGPRCPICGAPARADWRPFCSRRCADVDLGRWLAGSYAIAGEDDPDSGDGAMGPDGDDSGA